MATVAPAMAGFVPEKAFASDTQFTYGLKLLVGALERQLAPSGAAYPRRRSGDAG
jgi:hypothetical protein